MAIYNYYAADSWLDCRAQAYKKVSGARTVHVTSKAHAACTRVWAAEQRCHVTISARGVLSDEFKRNAALYYNIMQIYPEYYGTNASIKYHQKALVNIIIEEENIRGTGVV